ncbi:tyrosine--tRNA ligase [Candidatus Gracilibacteria bacterium CG17_big_fil_post_rev_8_21_14_2_50_48_13]|nr:MAG: tyrosine--tRNA ligase [Candidatus Gracilibacteria bacterium CG17_big_fil_post_rev_8_21_14_2_50_48_13]
MAQVRTDKELVELFLTRGTEMVYPTTEELRKKLMSGERLTVYQGFDPTGKFLHVGHAMGIRAMRILQQLGHRVIFLVGDFTSRVGDPDKESGRKMLTTEEIASNMAGWKEQAAQMIDFEGENPVEFMGNFDWLSKLTLSEVIELMSHMTVQQMLERDMFERRMKAGDPIRLQEFIYPLMQGYDSVAMNVDIEMCGADQTFNALTGRQLMRNYLGKEKFVRTNKMMDAPDGRTMSKTKGNGINLGDTSEDMYGKAMSYGDDKITMGLELLTYVPMEEIARIDHAIKNGENPMPFKKMMAFEIVKEIRGEAEAQRAQAFFEKTVQNKEIPEDIEERHLGKKEVLLLDFLVESGMVTSKGEGRRLMEQDGIKVDGKAVRDLGAMLIPSEDGTLVQKGKRHILRVFA